MRLTEKQKRQVLDACRIVRPGAKLVRHGDAWLAVWHVKTDRLLDVMRPPTVPPDQRWRAQQVVSVDTDGRVWWTPEVQARTRSQVLQEATQ